MALEVSSALKTVMSQEASSALTTVMSPEASVVQKVSPSLEARRGRRRWCRCRRRSWRRCP